MRLLPASTIGTECLAISAHIDDIAFSLGSALIDGRFQGLSVVTVFSHSNCTVGGAVLDSEEVTRVRKNEDRMFFRSVNSAVRRYYLDRLDAPLRLRISSERVFRNLSSADVPEIEHLATQLPRMLSRSSLLIAPLGLGGHVDHLIVREVTCGLEQADFAIAFYEDLPYAGRLSLNLIKRAVEMVVKDTGSRLSPCVIQSQYPASRKVEAIGSYRSQLEPGTIRQIVLHGERLGIDGFAERLWCNQKALKLIDDSLVK